ncbi:MAG TPA: ribbon-helix-helix domain-containing protein [Stellaceae bacterium]|jgi:predicted DNA-binding ribbon-helix-helix protein|nr:ribbon-helix-helix domain-containing protein [Stellaceae bacterium]
MAALSSRRPPRSRETHPSALRIRNVVVAGHRTSVRLEPLMWDALREIAGARGVLLNDLVTEIDQGREALSLTAAIRVFIVEFYRRGWGTAVRPAAAPVPA